jgi:hypothetical protein
VGFVRVTEANDRQVRLLCVAGGGKHSWERLHINGIHDPAMTFPRKLNRPRGAALEAHASAQRWRRWIRVWPAAAGRGGKGVDQKCRAAATLNLTTGQLRRRPSEAAAGGAAARRSRCPLPVRSGRSLGRPRGNTGTGNVGQPRTGRPLRRSRLGLSAAQCRSPHQLQQPSAGPPALSLSMTHRSHAAATVSPLDAFAAMRLPAQQWLQWMPLPAPTLPRHS